MLFNFALSVPALIQFNAVAGTGNTFWLLKIMLKTMVAYILYVMVVVVCFKVDIAISWTTEYIYAGMRLLLSAYYLKHKSWYKKI